MGQAKVKFFCWYKRMLTHFRMRVGHVFGKRVRLPMTNFSNLGIGRAPSHMVAAVPDCIVRRLGVSNQVQPCHA